MSAMCTSVEPLRSFANSVRARCRQDLMLNETGRHIRKFFSNARKLKNPFKYAIWRRACAQQKCIENIE